MPAGQSTTQLDTVQTEAGSLSSNVLVAARHGGVNQAPVVSAGPGQRVTLPSKAVLSGVVSDDGLPGNAVTVSWTKQSGPGVVTFDHAGQAATAASFSSAGSPTSATTTMGV